jgi:hypothetical protein
MSIYIKEKKIRKDIIWLGVVCVCFLFKFSCQVGDLVERLLLSVGMLKVHFPQQKRKVVQLNWMLQNWRVHISSNSDLFFFQSTPWLDRQNSQNYITKNWHHELLHIWMWILLFLEQIILTRPVWESRRTSLLLSATTIRLNVKMDFDHSKNDSTNLFFVLGTPNLLRLLINTAGRVHHLNKPEY